MKQKVNLSLDKEIADMLKQFATENHTTMSQLVTDAVLFYARKNDGNTNMTNHQAIMLSKFGK